MTEEQMISDWGDKKIIWINSEKIAECMNYYKNNNIDGIGISPHKNYKRPNLSFLQNFPKVVKGLVIVYAENIDISSVHTMNHLKFLTISGSKQTISLSTLSSLENLRLEWHNKIELPEETNKLKYLYLRKYNPKSKDLSELRRFNKLLELELNRSNINSFNGIESLELKKLQFSYLTNMQEIDYLNTLNNLKELYFEKCKKIQNHHSVRELKKLEILSFYDCGEIQSLQFIHDMAKLKSFRFVDTNIVDGDLNPLLNSNIEYAGFMNKHHYSHTFKEIEKKLIREAKTI